MKRKWFWILPILFTINTMGQTKLCLKAGLEYNFKGFDGVNVFDSEFGEMYFFTFSGASGLLRTLQLGGRFGSEGKYEGGVGLAFGQYDFAPYDMDNFSPKVPIIRKSIFVERYGNTERAVWLGTGAQLYAYRFSMEREFNNNYETSQNGLGRLSKDAKGLEWRVLMRAVIGKRKNHALTLGAGITGEYLLTSSFSLNNVDREYARRSSGVFGFAASFNYTFSIGSSRFEGG
jgi:hypothetical protein